MGTARRLILEENSEKIPECRHHEDQEEEPSGKAKGTCTGLGLEVLAAFKEQKAGKGISYWGDARKGTWLLLWSLFLLSNDSLCLDFTQRNRGS